MPNSPTLAEYRTEVRRLLHDSTGKFWSNAELNDYINDARERACADTGCLRSLVVGALSPGLEQYTIGGVTGVAVVSGGSGYLAPPLVSFVGDGTGAAATATLDGDSVTSVTVTDPGHGYTTPPDVVFTPGGGNGSVTLLVVSDRGSGYWTQPTLSLSGGGGSGATATVGLRLIAVYNAYSFGSGYALSDVCTLSGGTFTRAATVRPMASGSVSNGWIVVDPGEYTVVPGSQANFGGLNITENVALTGGSGSGASIRAIWGLSDAALTAGGSNYVSAPSVTINGGGPPSVTGTVVAVLPPAFGTVAQSYIIPSATVDILNVTVIRGNQRVPLGYMSFTEFNATMRVLTQNPQFPYRWSRYGTSGGAAFLQPVPDIAYGVEWDTCILPDPLVLDADVDVMQYPYTSPVAYYAAWKAKLKQQSYGEAEGFLKQYGQKVLMAQAAVQMRRIPNPYGGYSGS